MVVDILMCTYNGEKFIQEQIQSILNQTHSEFRLIIVDDISKDGTVDVIKKMMLLDDRIELYQNSTNLGYFDNFLSGLNYVKSDYLFFSDQDDIWDENKIAIQLKDLMNEDQKVLMNFSNSYLLYEEMNSESTFLTKRDTEKIKPYYTYSTDLALRNIVSGHTILMRTNHLSTIIENISRIKNTENIYFDYILTLVLLDLGEIKYIDQSLVYFRQHLNSTSTKMRMNYYTYVYSNAAAFSAIGNSTKSVKYFTILNKVLSKEANFLTYLKFSRQNLLNFKSVPNNYDFYQQDQKLSFLKKVKVCFKVSNCFYKQK